MITLEICMIEQQQQQKSNREKEGKILCQYW